MALTSRGSRASVDNGNLTRHPKVNNVASTDAFHLERS
jgi:hypothetical protein